MLSLKAAGRWLGTRAIVSVFQYEPRHLGAAWHRLLLPVSGWGVFSLRVNHSPLLLDCNFPTTFLSSDSTPPLATSSLLPPVT